MSEAHLALMTKLEELDAYTLLAEVQAGARPLPENTQVLIEALPPMMWPE